MGAACQRSTSKTLMIFDFKNESDMTMNVFLNATLTFHHNENYDQASLYSDTQSEVLSKEMFDTAYDVISTWDGYQETPLLNLAGLAKESSLGSILYKHEGQRFGLGSFKALGGAYSVLRLLVQEVGKTTGKKITADDVTSGEYADIIKDITVVTATDGNHGRSVAWGAQTFGCNCFIYMHAGVSQGRAKAVEDLDATVVWVDGNYDESVHAAAKAASDHGWFVVSDTSYEGYTELPKNVMAGYSVMTREISEQLKGSPLPTHVFIQGGVGGLAGAVCAHLWQLMGADRPRFVIVEPDRADCLFQSGVNDKITDVHIEEETIMAGLSCGEVSGLGWAILKTGCSDFMTITDELVAPVMKMLAHGVNGDKPFVAGESAVAGLAGALAARQNPEIATQLGLDDDSRILVFGTEGATDPEIYQSIVGIAPETIEA